MRANEFEHGSNIPFKQIKKQIRNRFIRSDTSCDAINRHTHTQIRLTYNSPLFLRRRIKREQYLECCI